MHHAFEKSRENMVEGQIRPSRVTNPVLVAALREIPRERFVPRHLQSIAYVDEDIAVGNGRFLPEPVITARLIQALDVGPGDIALDIGCGTGYSAALLGRMAGTVVGLENEPAMAHEADKLLQNLNVVNAVIVRAERLNEGYAQQGPYNVILINGSVPAIPDVLKNQLADGGRLAVVVSARGGMGTAMLVTRRGSTFTQHPLFDAATPLLAGFGAPAAFTF